MLKVTRRQDAGSITLIVEGRLAGPWVKELQDCWDHIPEHEQREAIVNLTGVTFIGQSGKELLHRMWQEGAELKTAGCLNNCLVNQITARSRVDRSNRHRRKTK